MFYSRTNEHTAFQFYKSTIITAAISLDRIGDTVSILQKYDYYQRNERIQHLLTGFNSTKVRLLPARRTERHTLSWVSILQKYDYYQAFFAEYTLADGVSILQKYDYYIVTMPMPGTLVGFNSTKV